MIALAVGFCGTVLYLGLICFNALERIERQNERIINLLNSMHEVGKRQEAATNSLVAYTELQYAETK